MQYLVQWQTISGGGSESLHRAVFVEGGSERSQAVGRDRHQLFSRQPHGGGDRPAGRPRIGAAQGAKVGGHALEGGLVECLEHVPHGLVRAVLGLRPKPQCREQLRGFVDEEAAGLGLRWFPGVCLDLA